MKTTHSIYQTRFPGLFAPIICCLALGIVMISTADYVYAAAEKGPKCSDGIDNDGDGLIDGDDPDCGGGETPLAIDVREAFADQDTDTLTLIGGPFTSPVVTFGDAQTELTNESVTETTITALLPTGLIAGDYAVNLADGGASTSFMFTIGAVGLTCNEITSLPYVISSDGHYCFTGNLSTDMASGQAIWIEADNVDLNLNGWMLDGLAAGSATLSTGIYAYEVDNVTIRNGTISGFYTGIYINGLNNGADSAGHLIENIHLDGNAYLGMEIKGNLLTIRDNRVTNTGGVGGAAYGIKLWGPGGRVLNNDVINTIAGDSISSIGIHVMDSDGSVVKDNRVHHVSGGGQLTGFGIACGNCNNTLIVDNQISDAGTGIFFGGGADNKYKDNLTSGVTTPFDGGIDAGGNN